MVFAAIRIPMSDKILIHHLFISSGHDFKGRHGKGRLNNGSESVEEVVCVEGKGLVGDRYFDFEDDYKGQLSLISLQAIGDMERDLGLKVDDYSAFRRNAVVSGVDLNALVGVDFKIGDVELRGVEQCKPCSWMEESIAKGALAALKDRGGLRCRVLSTGTLSLGESSISPLG